MNDKTDSDLLRAYAEHRSEPAFAELVHRHVDFVHSAALRMVCDSHLAQDVTQGVFIALAKNAVQLKDRPVLSGWLHRTAQNIAAQTVRTDVRRRAREQEATAMNALLSAESDAPWEHIAPYLDAALGELSEPDRDALLLRYFERKSAREMAQTLGISEDAAQKRVSRAVERLREFLANRGVTVGGSGLAVVISANAVQAAPAGLAATISTAAALAGTITSATVATHATLNIMTLKSTTLMVTAAIVAGTGTYFAEQHTENRLRGENQNFAAAQEKLAGERDAALAEASAKSNELEQLQQDRIDLVRLRAEVGLLRRQTNELQKLQEENHRLQSSLAQASRMAQQGQPNPEDDPRRKAAIDKINDAHFLCIGMLLYAADHQNNLPSDLNQFSAYLNSPDWHYTGTNQFELVTQGSLSGITKPSETIVLRETQATLVDGVACKAFSFADGHSEYKKEPSEGFDAWEKQHTFPQP